MSDTSGTRTAPITERFVVAGWGVDPSTHRIDKDGKTVKLEPRTIAVLIALARRPGETVRREELEREVWKDLVVGYDALSNTVAKLRKAFGDDPRSPTVIETIPKVGYRLIGEVARPSPAAGGATTPLPVPDPRMPRKLAAIFYADVAGYSRLTGVDEEGTHRALSAHLDVLTASIRRHNGDVVHFAGDAVLAEFAAVSDAAICAVAAQAELAARNEGVPADRRIQFRIGVNLGEVIVDRDDIYGDGVNVAARLETLAEPGGVCVSGSVFDAVGHALPLAFRSLGEQTVKNIAKPVRAYRVQLEPGAVLPTPARVIAGSSPRRARPAGVAAAIGAVALMVGVLAWLVPWQWKPDRAAPPAENAGSEHPSIAVLPFANLGGDPQQEYFADGMSDDLITDLSKLSGLLVIARHSAFSYKGKPASVDRVAEELGVRYVVEGSVRRAGGKIRINAQLVEAASGSHIWAERYDGDESDLFTLQDRVVGGVVSALALELTDTERQRLERRPTANLEAYDAFLRAEQDRTSDAFGRRVEQVAIRLYQDAIALDPRFAEAYAGLAETAFTVWRWDLTEEMPGSAARRLALDSASRALAVAPDNPRALGVQARLALTGGRHDEALGTARRAVSLNPNAADAYATLAHVLVYAGQHADALDAMQTAFRLNPKPPLEFHGEMGLVLFFNERYAQALAHLEPMRDSRSGPSGNFDLELAMVYAELGRLEDAGAVERSIAAYRPFHNLGYYRTLFAHHRYDQDLEHRISALQRAGVPEWPFDYRARPEHRLDHDALRALTSSRTWVGHDYQGAPFLQQFTDDGRVALRSRATLLSGNVRLRDDLLCVEYPAALLSREDCGYVYRNPDGSADAHDEYVRVSLGEIYFFSTSH